MKVHKDQLLVVALAFVQEALFNLWGLVGDDFVTSFQQDGLTYMVYDTSKPDPWEAHAIGIQLGMLVMSLGYLFISRTKETKPLFWAWGAYFLIQAWQVHATGNLQENELLVDMGILAMLFTTALLLSRWVIPKMKMVWRRS